MFSTKRFRGSGSQNTTNDLPASPSTVVRFRPPRKNLPEIVILVKAKSVPFHVAKFQSVTQTDVNQEIFGLCVQHGACKKITIRVSNQCVSEISTVSTDNFYRIGGLKELSGSKFQPEGVLMVSTAIDPFNVVSVEQPDEFTPEMLATPCFLPSAQSFGQFAEAPVSTVIAVLYGKVIELQSFNAGSGVNLILCVGSNCLFKISYYVNPNTPLLILNIGQNIAVTHVVKDIQFHGATESYLKKGSGTGYLNRILNLFSCFYCSHLDLSRDIRQRCLCHVAYERFIFFRQQSQNLVRRICVRKAQF